MRNLINRIIVLAVVAILVLSGCPRRNPKVGLRKDSRAERLGAYMAEELDPSRDEWQKLDHVIKVVNITGGNTVAVTWAGPGYFVIPIAKAVGPTGTVYASDPNMDMLEKLKQKVNEAGPANVKYVLAKPEDPQLPFGEVDVAFVVNAQAYIDLPYAFFDNVRRGLKTGGKVVVIDWKERSKKGPEKELRRPTKQVIKILKGMDFKLVTDDDSLPYQYFVIFKVMERFGEVRVRWSI